jgi:hypothetical protein
VVSGNYFSVLGVKQSAGRLLRPEDDREDAAPVAVISHTVTTVTEWPDSIIVSPTTLGSP